ncbi:MAG: MFS transporter [Deltaproteobacteria bacterium]|nr:MFS transporter [Deltaproteobacteria bacterium]
MQEAKAPEKERFHPSFWTANTTELFERGAYYAMASFVVIYLGRLGMGKYWPSTLNGLLWTLVYFLPILSGTIADHIGFRRSLLLAFVLLTGGYFLMGAPVWLFDAPLAEKAGDTLTSPVWMSALIVAAMILIGIGGSFVKPCISGTVQKTAGKRATLAFAIFYMVINVGSLCGRGVSYFIRTKFGLPYIFSVAMGSALVALLVVAVAYKEPPVPADQPAKPKRSILRILLDMFLVLGNWRFSLFLLVNSGFTFVYSQVYNVLPLYLEKVLEQKPAVDIYTMANPFVIVFFQLAVTRMFGKMKPIRSIVVGTVIIAAAMLINIVPLFMAGGARMPIIKWLPVGSLFVVLTVALIAFGELFAQARTYEYIGALAPKGQEGLFLGYANLPMAIGALTGGPVGAWIFNGVMCKGAVKNSAGLLDLQPTAAVWGWMILMGVGLASALLMYAYNIVITKYPARA